MVVLSWAPAEEGCQWDLVACVNQYERGQLHVLKWAKTRGASGTSMAVGLLWLCRRSLWWTSRTPPVGQT
jgi:hypothetical protein